MAKRKGKQPRLYNLREVAELCGIRKNTINYWYAQGRLNAMKIGTERNSPIMCYAKDAWECLVSQGFTGPNPFPQEEIDFWEPQVESNDEEESV